MNTNEVSTRRTFLQSAGSVLSVPLVVGGAGGAALVSGRPEESDDLTALRELHQAYAQSINAGNAEAVAALFVDPSAARIESSIRNVSADRFASHETIRLARNGETATVAIHCVVQTQTEIGPNCTLVEMARQQGDGVLRRSDARVLESSCVKRDGIWKLARAVFRS